VKNVEIMEIPEPQCTPNTVKVEVKYSGVCGTDIHIYHDRFTYYPPVILGHEFSGVVVEVGNNIRNIRPRDRVVVLGSTMVRCGVCQYCVQGNYVFCDKRRGMGHGVDGSFTKYVIVREDMVYKIDDSLTLEEAALAEPFACAVHAVEELTQVNIGDTIFISGPGPIGLLCLKLLLARGCSVIVAGTDKDIFRLEMAKKMGADPVVNVSKQDVDQIVGRETNNKGVDLVIEAAGAEQSVTTCLKQVKKMGKYIQIGLVGKEVSIDFDIATYKQLEIYGSYGHSLKTWDRVMRILNSGKISLESLITHKFSISDWEKAFNICESNQGIKVLLYY